MHRMPCLKGNLSTSCYRIGFEGGEPFRFSFLIPSKGGEADYPSGTDSFTFDSDVGIGNVFFDPFPCA